MPHDCMLKESKGKSTIYFKILKKKIAHAGYTDVYCKILPTFTDVLQ